MRRVLADSSALFAYAVRTERFHSEATVFVDQLLAAKGQFILLDFVFSEVMTLFRSRFYSQAAPIYGCELRASSFYQWAPLGEEGERATWINFQKYDDKGWSFVDCALFTVSQQINVREIFTFDSHFDQMPGVRRVPK